MARIRISMSHAPSSSPVPRAFTLKELGSNLLTLRIGDKCTDQPGVTVIDHGYIQANKENLAIVQLALNGTRVNIVQLAGPTKVALEQALLHNASKH